MKYHLSSLTAFLAAATLLGVRGDVRASLSDQLTVHEWGTFTSIAGENGNAVEWLPQTGPSDLPCFVERLGFDIKANLWGTVRMETPVLYFYAPRDMIVNVSVRFRQGLLTEWFPKASATPSAVEASVVRNAAVESTLAWTNIKVTPGASSDFPIERGSSHYYLARSTDASAVQAGLQKEKFLFYRGVGRFSPPLAATVAGDGKVIVTSLDGGPVGDVMLFENRGGRRAYDVRRAGTHQATLSVLPEGEASPEEDLRAMLVAHGLFPKEVKAMIDTWRDSWFEQGTRVFYIVSRQTTDSILPLHIAPTPAAIARVFVGRMEVITPTTQREVREAIARSDHATLAKYERFLQAITDRMLASDMNADRRAIERGLQAFYEGRLPSATGCN